jgi:hypothetical protein
MPRKDFVVTVTISEDGKKVTDVTFGTTAAYADMKTPYVMNYHGSLIGTNKLDVQVGDSGLLSMTKSSSESKISDALKGAAALAGITKGVRVAAMPPTEKEAAAPGLAQCPAPGAHTFVYAPKDQDTDWTADPCGVKVTFRRLADGTGSKTNERAKSQSHPGLFYRLDEPYLVLASGRGMNKATVLFSPSRSPTYFLPLARSLFAKNEADLTLSDGVLKKYRQESDGELIAFLKLPADVLSAYFSAIGSTLDAFKDTDAKEAAALAEATKLELAKKKFDECLAAIRANDTKMVEALKCSE